MVVVGECDASEDGVRFESEWMLVCEDALADFECPACGIACFGETDADEEDACEFVECVCDFECVVVRMLKFLVDQSVAE